MKKLVFLFLLTVILCGLSGCRTSRATVKTDTDRNTRQTVVTDSSRSQQTTSSDQKTAALSSNEQQTVVIEFDEWEYYQPGDTGTAGNYAQNSPDFIRDTQGDADKPPNAGAVKRHKKRTITINGTKETTGKTEQAAMIQTDTKEAGSLRATADEGEKVKASTKKDSRKAYVWKAVGLLLAAIFVGIGIYLARRK